MNRLSRDFTVIDATNPSGVRDVISNPRVITGYTKLKGIGLVPYEGPLERDFLVVQDFGGQIAYAGAQPLRIQFREDGRVRYTPDYLLQFRTRPKGIPRSPALLEIKPRIELKANWRQYRPGFLRAALLCRDRGWRFRIATDRLIRGPRFSNIQFLRGYLSHPDHKAYGQIMYESLKRLGPATPSELLATSFSSVDVRMEAIGVMWKYVAGKIFLTDLTKKLTMESTLWLNDYGRSAR